MDAPLEAPVPPPPFESVFRAEFSWVWKTLRRLGVHDRDLEDVTHDVFVAVHRKLGDFDASRPLRPWLFGFALRVASDWRRLARHREESRGAPEARDSRPPADEAIGAAERRALVREALDALDDDRRAVFVLHELDGIGVPEIAAGLEVPVNTAYSRLRLAREDFRAAVRRIQTRRGER